MNIIQERFKISQSCHKFYTDVRRKELEFKVDDRVYFKVSPMKGAMIFSKNGNSISRYIGLLKISMNVRNVYYELEIP